MKVIFSGKNKIADNIYTFTLTPEKKPSYIAGQFIEMYLPHQNKDSRGDKRWFTLSSSPTEEELAVTTRIVGDVGSSFKKTLYNLKPGTEVTLSSPMGDFVLPKDKTIPLVFIAAGIGCTPFRSMTCYLIDTGEIRDISLLYAGRDKNSFVFSDEFSTLRGKVEKCVNTRITAQNVLTFAGQSDKTRYFYISGPEPMVETITRDLRHSGINKKHIFTDYFPGYNEI